MIGLRRVSVSCRPRSSLSKRRIHKSRLITTGFAGLGNKACTAHMSSRVKSQVYTRTGDKGVSSLFNGQRKEKTSDYFEALGDTDELNAQVGVARELCLSSSNGLADKLAQIQSRLFDIGAHVATPRTADSSEAKLARTVFSEHNVQQLEEWIDELDASLPPLKTFILPGGGLSSAHLHVARAVSRRAERRVHPLVKRGDVDAVVGRYLNRLSDFFFVAARFASNSEGKSEAVWQKGLQEPSPGTGDTS